MESGTDENLAGKSVPGLWWSEWAWCDGWNCRTAFNQTHWPLNFNSNCQVSSHSLTHTQYVLYSPSGWGLISWQPWQIVVGCSSGWLRSMPCEWITAPILAMTDGSMVWPDCVDKVWHTRLEPKGTTQDRAGLKRQQSWNGLESGLVTGDQSAKQTQTKGERLLLSPFITLLCVFTQQQPVHHLTMSCSALCHFLFFSTQQFPFPWRNYLIFSSARWSILYEAAFCNNNKCQMT